MPLNPNIILGVQRPKFTSPQELYAQKSQFEQNALASRMGNIQLQRAEQEQADNQTERGIYSKFGADTAANQNMLMQAGLGKQALAYGKSQADAAKSGIDSKKSAIELQLKRFELGGQVMSGVTDQATYDQARQQMASIPELADVAAKMPPQYNPEEIERNRLKALPIKEQLEQKWKAMEYTTPNANARLSADTARANNQASNAVSMRGQNLKFQTDSGANAAVVGKKVQDVELKMQDDYRQESKGFAETSTSMKKILGAIETADKNPGSALAAGTAFMKILDPNSVVRETELGMALNASGWFDRATNVMNTLQRGRIMTSEQKKNLKAAAENLFEEAKAAQLEVDAAYRKRATDYGASPERVIVDRGQNKPRPAGAAAPAAGGLPQGWKVQAR